MTALPSYFTARELEEVYPDISLRQWWSWAKRGKIRTVKSAGRDMLIPASEVKRILQKKAPMTSLYQDWADQL